MIFDSNTPYTSSFQKPIFGSKTLLRNPDGTRTGLSKALSAGVNWMSALSPLGAGVGQGIDNFIQGDNTPSYLRKQSWYNNNVVSSDAKGQSIGQIAGGIGTQVRSLAQQLAGSMTGGSAAASSIVSGGTGASSTPSSSGSVGTNTLAPPKLKQTEDPQTKLSDMINTASRSVMTPYQRALYESNVKTQMSALPSYDQNIDMNMSSDSNPFRFYISDTPSLIPNFLK